MLPHPSDPFFRTFHALRIKGFAKAETVAEVADLPLQLVDEHLSALEQREWAKFREARELWQLTPVGREEHHIALAEDSGGLHLAAELADAYAQFLGLNETFKNLCGEWQLRDGKPNDHADSEYDRAVVNQLVALNRDVAPIVARMGAVLARLAPYEPRLARTCQRVVDGETNMFTGVMCGSYHDVWMELHEDLILTQGIDRAAEGSF
ncbi:MAG: MarR family transcriptional regulator [Actinomycetota bacterium]|nr:MarR family transcriptional regulator [Actinomycetota bacterium]